MPQDPTTLVMTERPPENPRPTFVHKRGEFLQPAERVEPAVLSMLRPMPAEAPHNRLGLARWLVSGSNPLTGRVTMNRQWAAFFGTGLVRTVEDFGYQGERPTHPELLDWLALSLVEAGWSMKAMHRADRHERDLPAVVAGHARAAGEGPREPAACPRSAGARWRPR